jgi:hypothetical protein
MYGHRVATIYQCDTMRAITLDLDSREYISYEIDDKGRPVRSQPGAVPMPPIRPEPSGATLNVYLDDVDTGERKTMFGYTARHSIRTERHVPDPGAVSQPQEVKHDGWYIDLDVLDGCPPGRFARSQGVKFGLVTLGSAGSVTKMDKIEMHHTGVQEAGFPVELTTSSPERMVRNFKIPGSTSKSEVTELSTAPLDPALFELPAGFKQVTQLADLPPRPPSSVLLRIWAWVRQTISLPM